MAWESGGWAPGAAHGPPGGPVRSLEAALEVAEPVAAALDVEEVAAVQEAVEEGGGHDLVAGQDLGPVLDRLVRKLCCQVHSSLRLRKKRSIIPFCSGVYGVMNSCCSR